MTSDMINKIDRTIEQFVKFNFEHQPHQPDQSANDYYPKLSNFYDVIEKRDALINAVKRFPEEDKIYYFKLSSMEDLAAKDLADKPLHDMLLKAEWNWCIAGSAAIAHVFERLEYAKFVLAAKYQWTPADLKNYSQLVDLVQMNLSFLNLAPQQFIEVVRQNLESLKLTEDNLKKVRSLLAELKCLPFKFYGEFKPEDTDIFHLKSPIPHRKVFGNVDIVHTKAESVEELLMNFDLPCCRAATNSRNEYWVSAQCLYAMLTGRYFLPDYLRQELEFSALLQAHRNGDPMHLSEKALYERMQSRIKKYQMRGFSPVWIQTSHVQSWIKNRFHYAEWKQQ